MSDKDYLDDDYEVIGMVNRRHGPGGGTPRQDADLYPHRTR